MATLLMKNYPNIEISVPKLLSLEDLEEEISKSSLNDLKYIQARYCGPNNILMRCRRYDYIASSKITKLISEAVFYKELEETLLNHIPTDDTST